MTPGAMPGMTPGMGATQMNYPYAVNPYQLNPYMPNPTQY
jgi:hypothetical protein